MVWTPPSRVRSGWTLAGAAGIAGAMTNKSDPNPDTQADEPEKGRRKDAGSPTPHDALFRAFLADPVQVQTQRVSHACPTVFHVPKNRCLGGQATEDSGWQLRGRGPAQQPVGPADRGPRWYSLADRLVRASSTKLVVMDVDTRQPTILAEDINDKGHIDHPGPGRDIGEVRNQSWFGAVAVNSRLTLSSGQACAGSGIVVRVLPRVTPCNPCSRASAARQYSVRYPYLPGAADASADPVLSLLLSASELFILHVLLCWSEMARITGDVHMGVVGRGGEAEHGRSARPQTHLGASMKLILRNRRSSSA